MITYICRNKDIKTGEDLRGEKHILSNCIDKVVASYSSALQGNREELELPVLMELQVHRYE